MKGVGESSCVRNVGAIVLALTYSRCSPKFLVGNVFAITDV